MRYMVVRKKCVEKRCWPSISNHVNYIELTPGYLIDCDLAYPQNKKHICIMNYIVSIESSDVIS